MSAPKPIGEDGSLPPPEDAHEISLSGDEDPLIVLSADAPPVPPDPLELLPVQPAVPASPAPQGVLRAPSSAAAVGAVIDDLPTANLPPARRAQAPHTTEPPSIATDRVREPLAFPSDVAPDWRKQSPPSPSPWPRRALLLSTGALLASGVWAAYSRGGPHPPVLTSIVPAKAEPGQTVTLAGTSLGTDTGETVVRFGDYRGAVTSAAGASLAATIPAELANLPPGAVRVVVEVGGASSNALFMTLARYPKITGVEPEVALPGNEVAIAGRHLEGDTVVVRIGGFPAEVVGRNREGVRVKVPAMPVIEGRAVPVDISLGREAASPGTLILGHLPLVTSIAPASGEVGTVVTIKGHGFDPRVGGNRVAFGALDALLLSASAREIQAAVPALGLLGSRTTLRAVVSTGAGRSAPFEFTAVRPSGEVFRPRFVPAPAPGADPGRNVLVATELGPVLVLTGPADAATTAERANRAAARLNALLQAATSRPVLVEVHEGPLRLSASGTTIVHVTDEDAEGLARGWDGVRGARVAAPALARYWAALLQDYVGLFGQRLRPNLSIDLTPHARVLLDLYSDAERRGAGAGVGTAIVSGMAPGQLEAIRRLAYAGPDEARASRGMALAGAWEGTLDEGGRPRPMRLQIRLDGARLAGAMTSTAGKLQMGIPLHDLRYDKGMLRYSAVLGGAPMHFRGALDGATLAGTIHPAEGAAAVGQFTVRHVE